MPIARRLYLPFVLLVYLSFLTNSYFWDGVLFSYNIEQVVAHSQPFATLLTPNHLLYSVFGWCVYGAAKMMHLNFRAITVLQFWDCIVSVALAWRIFRWARKHTGNYNAAVCAVILLAFGATWWKYATDANSYIIATRLFCVAILFVLEERPSLLAAGACHVTAMLFHELAIFAYFPILIAISMQGRRLAAAVYAAATGSAVLAVYWGCWKFAHPGLPLIKWVTTYASDTDITHSARQLAINYVVSFAKLFGGGKFSAIRDFFSFWTVLGLLVAAAALVGFVVLLKRQAPFSPLDRRSRIVLIAWVVPMAVFLAWFDPGNAAHKLFLWPPIVMLIVSSRWVQRHSAAAVCVAVALAGWNFAGYIYPHSRPDGDPVVSFAIGLNNKLAAGTTVYYAAFSPDDWYLAYLNPQTRWQRIPDQVPAHACFDTTAIQTHPGLAQSLQGWALQAKGHNIRIACR